MQYDVYQLTGDLIVCDIQSDIASELTTSIIIPMLPTKETNTVKKLNPVVILDDKEFTLKIEQMTAIPKINLKNKIGNIARHHYDIANAIDLIFCGI